MSEDRFDVVIVGASIAGCVTAIALARKGFKVAVIDRETDLGAYKKLCTHYLQPSAVKTLEQLGLLDFLMKAGAVQTLGSIWVPQGWIPPEADPALSLRREVLDPLLRQLAVDSGAQVMMGAPFRRIERQGGRAAGVWVETGGTERLLACSLVVGADGRESPVAAAVGLREKRYPNCRFGYFGYYRGLAGGDVPETRGWLFDGRVILHMPTDSGQSLVGVYFHKDQVDAVRRDPEAEMRKALAELPGAPDLSRGERVGATKGFIEYPLIRRGPLGGGVALVGDAATSPDPFWGVGCGWAIQSASWLAQTLDLESLSSPAKLDASLRRYAREYSDHLGGHLFMLSGFAARPQFSLLERLFFIAATRDSRMARHVHSFIGRSCSLAQFLSPVALARALWAAAGRPKDART